MQTRQAKKVWWALFPLLVAVGFLRYLPIYFDNPEWHPDIALNGNFAYHFINGRFILPFFAYSFPPYAHGPQVMSLILIPFYYFGGPYFGWLLILGVLISSLIFAFSVSLLSWNLKDNKIWAILLVIVFFLLPPPIYTYFMRAIWGSHFETTLLLVISLVLFCWMAKNENLKYPLFVSGLFLGFACYFCYTSASFALALTCATWYLKGKKFLRNLWLFVLGFLIGFLPAILYNLTYDKVILGRHLSYEAIASSYPEARLGRNVGFVAIYDLAFNVVPRFLSCKVGFCESNAFSVLFAMLFGASLIYLFWSVFFKRDKNPLELGILSSFVGFTLFYAISPYAVFDYKNEFYYRYVIFLFPAIVISISLLLKHLKVFAPIVAIALSIISYRAYSYPTKGDFEYIFKSKKGYDLARVLYIESMKNYLNRDKTEAFKLASRISSKTKGFEKVVALKELGSYRLSLFEANEKQIEERILSKVSASDIKWLAFGWGVAQAECFSQEKCDMPAPSLSDKDEQKWFSVGFVLGHFWKREDGYFKREELELLGKVSAEDLAFAFGFSAGDSVRPLPPHPQKPENHREVIREYLNNLGYANNPVVREKFWRGVGCETAFWFLTENFLARESDFKGLMAPPELLENFDTSRESLEAGWHECLKEFECEQIEEEWKIGRIVKIVCEGEKF